MAEETQLEPVFESQEHCVAYRTQKEMFFFFDADVIGKNCEVSAAVELSEDGSKARIAVNAPVNKFDSGTSGRDENTVEILKGDQHPTLAFRTGWVPVAMLQKGLKENQLTLKGELELAGKVFPMVFPLRFSKGDAWTTIESQVQTTFAALEVEIPSVGPGGMIADSVEKVEILVHLRSDRVEGLGKLMALSQNTAGTMIATHP